MENKLPPQDQKEVKIVNAMDFKDVRAMGEAALKEVEALNPGFQFKLCRKCGSTGVMGANTMTRQIVYCSCVHKQVIKNKLILTKEENKDESKDNIASA